MFHRGFLELLLGLALVAFVTWGIATVLEQAATQTEDRR